MLRTDYISTKSKSKKRIGDFNWSIVLYSILAFLMGRANIIGDLTPFGWAFFAAYTLRQKFNVLILISAIMGLVSFHGLGGMDYVFMMIVVSLVATRLKSARNHTYTKSSIIAGIILVVIKLLYLILFKSIALYDLFIIGFEGLVAFTLTYMFSYGFSMELGVSKSSNERFICTIISLAIVLLGIHDYSLWGASIKNIASILLIIYFGYKEGAFVAGTIGMILGMVSYVSQAEMPFLIAIYGLSGLLAGAFRDLGKVGSILGFFLGNGIISFYINGFGISFLYLKEIIPAMVLFCLLYKPLDQYISKNLTVTSVISKERSYSYKKDQLAVKRINELSMVFKELGETFKGSVRENDSYDMVGVYELINNIANSTCAGCGKRKFCWEEDFYTSYYSIFRAIGLLEDNKVLDDEYLPQPIRDYCINKEEIKEEIIRSFEKFKINNMWQKKILENRLLVSEQLEGVSKIMRDVGKEIYINPIFKEDMEEEILIDLKEGGVDVRKVMAVEFEDEELEIYIEIGKPYRKENKIENIRQIASNTLGVDLKLDHNSSSSKGEKREFKLIKSNRYNALTEVVSQNKDEDKISGDSYTFGENLNDYFIVISDGMGVGRRANDKSSTAIRLFEKLLEARFDSELVLKTINSILMLKSNEEVFATLDIGLIDLYTGKLQIIKSGASSTFIRRKNGVDIVNNQSLPVGILKDVAFNIYEESLNDGDIVIMMSDGLLEANRRVANADKWMGDIIKGIDSPNPKRFAQEIMEAVKEKSPGEIGDDMTLLVTKVWKTHRDVNR